MAAVIVDIADAVVEALNGASLSQTFTAERAYVPIHSLPDLTTLKVTVVPSGLSSNLLNRKGANQFDFVIDIGIQQTFGQGNMTNAEVVAACDPLMFLAEEIADLFRDGSSLAGYTSAHAVTVENQPIFAPHHIEEQRVFTSIISLTFRLVK